MGKQEREKIRKELNHKAFELSRSIGDEVMSYRPIGRQSDVAVAIGLKPKRGVAISTPAGDYVFAKARIPSKETVKKWFTISEEVNKLRDKAIRCDFFICGPNTTIGNIRVLEHGKELASESLLSKDELDFVRRLEDFWTKYPEADSGVVRPDGTIEPLFDKGHKPTKSSQARTRQEELIMYDKGHTLEELKKMCRDRGLTVSGSKKELIARLI